MLQLQTKHIVLRSSPLKPKRTKPEKPKQVLRNVKLEHPCAQLGAKWLLGVAKVRKGGGFTFTFLGMTTWKTTSRVFFFPPGARTRNTTNLSGGPFLPYRNDPPCDLPSLRPEPGSGTTSWMAGRPRAGVSQNQQEVDAVPYLLTHNFSQLFG